MNILIVDDHPLFREGLQFVLSDLDDGLVFKDAASLDNLTQGILDSCDLILLDLGLAGSDGIESLIKLKQRQPNGAIVVISGNADISLVRSCIDHGAAGFIPKTSGPTQLITALRLVLDGGIYLPPNSLSENNDLDALQSENQAIDRLTARQRTALLCAGRGMPNKTIATQMDITEGTVKLHLSAAYKSLGVRNRTEAVYLISRTGLTNERAGKH